MHDTGTTSGFVAELRTGLSDALLVTDPERLESYRWDRTPWIDPGRPVAAALPTTTSQVQSAVEIAARHQVPIVPRGAGSGLAGGASAIEGCLVLSLERMDRILDFDIDDRQILVEPGVLNDEVSKAVGEHGLWYPPDPASSAFCTIGGNVATNAGGLCCVKYGVTRDHVLGLEIVLADGSVIETGRRTVKGVAGLDLTQLFVGSEGTLGVVTGVRLALRPRPPRASTMVATFPSLSAAGAAIMTLVAAPLSLSLLEFIDHTTLVAIDDWRNMSLDRDAAALLLVQSDAPEPTRTREVEEAARICGRAGASFTAATGDPDEAEALLEARRLAYPALEQGGMTILDDIAVPQSRIPAALGRIDQIAERHHVTIGSFGHAGDGNIHPTIVVPRGDEAAAARAEQAFEAIVAAAIELGGTVTGEHGIGTIKRRFLDAEVGSANLAVQHSIKAALDPGGIMNPGRGF